MPVISEASAEARKAMVAATSSGRAMRFMGVYAATFSSALASLVGAPQMLYAVAKDQILPFGFFTTNATRATVPHNIFPI